MIRCLNSPPDLNSLEVKITETAPADARHVIIVGAGDGRLARSLKEKLGEAAVVKVVEHRSALQRYLSDFSSVGTRPWDLDWYKKEAEKDGPVDYLIFYQLHEYWGGEVRTLRRLIELVKPEGRIWVSFLNALGSRVLERMLPPVQVSAGTLADPLRLVAQLDFASWTAYLGLIGAATDELWGLLDQRAFEFCQKPPKEPATWDVRGTKMHVGTMADALLWGGSFCALQFHMPKEGEAQKAPTISGAPYSGALFQGLAYPYPETIHNESELLMAEREVEIWQKQPEPKIGNVTEFFFTQVGDLSSVRSALLIGCGWGRDLLVLKNFKPEWDWTGVDLSAEKLEIGRQATEKAGVKTAAVDLEKPLPFEDGSFDVVISLGFFSHLHFPAGKHLGLEALRVARKGVYMLEDGRGADHSMLLKQYSLKAVYNQVGKEATVQPLLVKGEPSGMYVLKLDK